jgi:hypothetical protein
LPGIEKRNRSAYNARVSLPLRSLLRPATLILLLLSAALLPAEQSLELSALVGLTLEEAHQRLGVPDQVYALRGEDRSQDDVVYYYENHLYLFWFQNRVWQVRADGRFGGRVFSLPMRASRKRVLEVLGEPILEFPDSLVFHIEDRGYPVKARLYFEEGLLSDVYVFRGDL